MRIRTLIARAALAAGLAFISATAFAQPSPPPPGTTNLDTDGDGTQDVGIRRLDTDGVAGTTERVHVDGNKNGVIEAGERVFDNVIGYMIVNGVLTIVENTGTEHVRTVIVPFDKNHDGDCDDDGEVIQRNQMSDSSASVQIRFPDGSLTSGQLTGATTFAANLRAIAPVGGFDTIPIEIVSLSLSGGPQPITVVLRQQPAPGMLIEDANLVGGNLDARLLAPNGTLESFFDVIVEIDLGTGRLVPQQPLRLRSTNGIYPPAPMQTYLLVNAPVPLFDAATGQFAGVLERFDFTPHVAAGFFCDCEKISIKPVVETEKGKPLLVISPSPGGAINGDDQKVFDVEIAIDWLITIKCDSGTFGCDGTYRPSATSANWMIDGKKSAPVGPDSHDGTDAGGTVECAGVCDREISLAAPKRTTYKVSVKKGAGGIITNKVSGEITLEMKPVDCAGDPWKMVLVYEADVKKGEIRIDANLSNWDGDKKINAADKNPLDPSKL